MHLEPDPMAEAVAKQLSISCLVKVLSRDGIGIPPRHSGTNPPGCPLIGDADDVIYRPVFVTCPSYHHRARDVRAISSDLRPEVHQQKIAGLDGPRGRSR